MLEFMAAGGVNMWLMLVTAVAALAVGLTRPAERRAAVFHAGTVLVLIEGVAGLGMGLSAVSANFGRFPDKVEAIGLGLGELANNGTFGAALAAVLGLATLVAARAPAGVRRE